MKFLFTIIIPHKDIPKLLERCLESIPKRDDMEIIVIDDNSDPSIVDFSDFPGKNRPYTTLIFDKSGMGAGRARNIGLSQAKGEWILFSDADDIFESPFNNILDLLAKDELSDVVNFEVTSRNLEDNQPNDEIEKIGYHCNKSEYIDNPQSFKYVVLTPWGKAIRRNLIEKHNIRYEEVPYGNDLLFATLVDFYCQHRRIIPLTGYCWMYRRDSLWRQKNLNWANVRYNVLLHAGDVMRKFGENSIADRYYEGACTFLFIIYNYSRHDFFKYLLNYLMDFRSPVILLKQLLGIVYSFAKKKFFNNSSL